MSRENLNAVNETILVIKNEIFGNYGKPNAVVKPMQRSDQQPFNDLSNSAKNLNQNKFIHSDKIDQNKHNKISIIIKDVENQLKNLQSDSKQKSSKNVKEI